MIVVKLGGSLITYKGSDSLPPYRWNEISIRYRIKENSIKSAAALLGPFSSDRIVIIHGGGTHGHRTVKRWSSGVVKGDEPRRIWEVKWRMLQLTESVVRILGQKGLPAVSVSPSDILRVRKGSIDRFDPSSIREILEAGCVPVLRGDLAADTEGGWSVVSGDEIMVELVKKGIEGTLPRSEKAIMCLDIEGFYEDLGGEGEKVHDEITRDLYHRNMPLWRSDIPTGETKGDVTGGILRKVSACHRIAAMECDAWLTGGDLDSSLGPILQGGHSGTLFRGFKGTSECIEGSCLLGER
ncbi:MAG: hypothetical protein ACMUHY_02005 [Thermoplasmatota archaeon]